MENILVHIFRLSRVINCRIVWPGPRLHLPTCLSAPDSVQCVCVGEGRGVSCFRQKCHVYICSTDGFEMLFYFTTKSCRDISTYVPWQWVCYGRPERQRFFVLIGTMMVSRSSSSLSFRLSKGQEFIIRDFPLEGTRRPEHAASAHYRRCCHVIFAHLHPRHRDLTRLEWACRVFLLQFNAGN